MQFKRQKKKWDGIFKRISDIESAVSALKLENIKLEKKIKELYYQIDSPPLYKSGFKNEKYEVLGHDLIYQHVTSDKVRSIFCFFLRQLILLPFLKEITTRDAVEKQIEMLTKPTHYKYRVRNVISKEIVYLSEDDVRRLFNNSET